MDSAKTDIRLRGVPASPGIAIGEVRVVDRCRISVVEAEVAPEQVGDEVTRLLHGLEKAREELRRVKEEVAAGDGREHLFVIDAHLLILEDSMLLREIVCFIENERLNAESALRRTAGKFRELFSSISDDYLKQRGTDVEIVLERVLRHLVGKCQAPLPAAEGRIIIAAHDLSPADILQMDRDSVIGFVTDLGGSCSHTAILARSLEIPAVVGLEQITSTLTDGDILIVDGSDGTVSINPDDETFRDYLSRKQHYEYVERELLKLRDLPAETTDGHHVALQGNAEFVEELATVKKHGGEGIGLYRTELLFMRRQTLPDEDEQYQAYAAMVREAAPHPVSIRTLDIGGDKHVTELHLEDEANPALGVRGIRLSLRDTASFKSQIRAILRAGAEGSVRIFFPMVSGVEEIRAAKRLLAECKNELSAAGIRYAETVETGIVIEVPSAVITADLLAREVDFFSVGTNDLIQYTLGVDRTNEHLADLYRPLHPAILRSLKMIVDAARAAGIKACMCGEMAGNPHYLPILLGLGFQELSMNPVSIPRVKKILRRCSRAEAEQLAARCLELRTVEEVEMFLKSEIIARYCESID